MRYICNKLGGLWFARNWNGTKTVEQTLGGGNLVVQWTNKAALASGEGVSATAARVVGARRT